MKIEKYLKGISITSKSITSTEYLKLGISEEYGEIMGKVKRYCRGDYRKEDFKSNIKKELGDLTYYVAVLEERTGNVKELRAPHNKHLKDNLHNLTALNANIFNAKHPRHLTIALHTMMNTITDLAWNFGFTMTEIMETNLSKINSRYIRNQIKGSGDER